MTTSLTGNDTITLNGRILNDSADGDIGHLTFPNDIMAVKTGKNGNSLYAFNATGRQCELMLRVIRGSSDDKFLNGLFAEMAANPPAFSLVTGEFIKNIGDGAGNILQDIYVMTGGVFKKAPEVVENMEGNIEQAVTIWTLTFTNAPRSIG